MESLWSQPHPSEKQRFIAERLTIMDDRKLYFSIGRKRTEQTQENKPENEALLAISDDKSPSLSNIIMKMTKDQKF